MLTHDVAFWTIRRIKRRKPYELRWRTGAKRHSRSFLTRSLADDFRADLLKAARRGERFDIDSGLPDSMSTTEDVSSTDLSWFELARKYVAERWEDDAAKTREGIVDALATATLALVDRQRSKLRRSEARTAMRWALLPSASQSELPPKYVAAVEELTHHTLPVRRLSDPEVAKRLRKEIGLKLDGSRASAETLKGRRRKLYTALEYGVELGVLEENPLRTVRGKRVKEKKIAQDVAVDPRVVANPHQVGELLAAVTYVGSWHRARGRRLKALYAVMYYAGARPSEAIGLVLSDCVLPDQGSEWGKLTLAATRPASEKKFTNTGDMHDLRGLKQREDGATRIVSVPPILVSILRCHLDEFGTAPDGRLFRTEQGKIVGKSMYAQVWREARALALPPDQATSPLAATPYDLRHAALSLWLNGGVDPTEVAERAGNSVDVLLRVYAKCLDGRREHNNRLIAEALSR